LTKLAIPRPKDITPACSEEELLEGVALWMVGAREEDVAKALHCPVYQVKYFAKKPGWNLIVDLIREDVTKVAGNRLARLSQRCFDLLEERLEGGDPVYDLDHNIIGYRAIRARDLSNMMAQLIDRQKLLNQGTGPTDPSEKPLTLKDLANLLEREAKLKKFNEAKEITAEVTVQ
jgi:hypothetical protein